MHKDDTGNYKLDLSKYNICVYDNVFIALENVAVYTSETTNPESKKVSPTIYISGTAAGSRGLVKNVSMGKWKELPLTVSPGFWVTVLN